MKLHLGCGGNRMSGWVNIDTGGADVNADLTKPWPFPDASARLMYTEHMLEHMTPTDGEACLREAFRVLKPGGVIRIALPSVSHLCKLVAEGRWKEQDWLTWPQFSHVQTAAEMMNMVFRDWGHQWMYDEEELERRLRNAGFTDVTTQFYGHSVHDELKGLESRKDSLLITEATR